MHAIFAISFLDRRSSKPTTLSSTKSTSFDQAVRVHLLQQKKRKLRRLKLRRPSAAVALGLHISDHRALTLGHLHHHFPACYVIDIQTETPEVPYGKDFITMVQVKVEQDSVRRVGAALCCSLKHTFNRVESCICYHVYSANDDKDHRYWRVEILQKSNAEIYDSERRKGGSTGCSRVAIQVWSVSASSGRHPRTNPRPSLVRLLHRLA